MSKAKNICAPPEDAEKPLENVAIKEDPGQCDLGPHIEHTAAKQCPRRSEVCTLEPPPPGSQPMCGRQKDNGNEDERKIQCRVIEDEEGCRAPPPDDAPTEVPQCGETGEKQNGKKGGK
ncbi:uncharacterized protein LOC124167150 [Ischnura elegans]|uniref:uncharacterized protein LOC124167150 n=1 Tax=Ischnura elegans TaxID=197161 RepID=UPI001ED8B5F3|nr:uncharacterized protein LOC124167150 [Ischnura elegans]